MKALTAFLPLLSLGVVLAHPSGKSSLAGAVSERSVSNSLHSHVPFINFSGTIRVAVPGNDRALFIGANVQNGTFYALSTNTTALEVNFAALESGITDDIFIEMINSDGLQANFPILSVAENVVLNTGNKADLHPGSSNTAFFTGGPALDPGPVEDFETLFSSVTGIDSPFENAVWRFNAHTLELQIIWTNTNGQEVVAQANQATVDGVSTLFITGDLAAVTARFRGDIGPGIGSYRFFLVSDPSLGQ